MKIFAFKEEELNEKTKDANFSLPIKNPESAIKNRFRIRIPKLGGFRIRIAIPNKNVSIFSKLKVKVIPLELLPIVIHKNFAY